MLHSRELVRLTPSLPQPVKFQWAEKCTHTPARSVIIFLPYNKSTFSTVRFMKILTYNTKAEEKKKKGGGGGLKDLKFLSFITRFQVTSWQ